jgi:hypothetical protein
MPTRILHAPTRAAYAAAPTQQEQCEAVRDAFAGNVTLRIEGAGGQHLRTMTLAPFAVNTSTPRGIVCGAVLADTAVAPIVPGEAGIAPTRWEFRNGSTPMFETDDVVQGPIRTLCQPRFGAVVFTANPALPVAPVPNAALNLIAAAHAAGHIWVRLDDPVGAPTFDSVIPPTDLLDHSGGPPNDPRGMWYVWASWAYSPAAHKFTCWGVGHANSSSGEVISWSALTRGFVLDYNGNELVQVGPAPLYRSKDFNATPVSAHCYSNNTYLPVSGRFCTLPGASYGTGGSNAVFDPAIPGDQPGLHQVGAWSLDMGLAGQGYVAGTTGSNPRRGTFAGVDLPGANAWRLHDWFAPSAPLAGLNLTEHIDRGAVAVEESGADVLYYTAGPNWALVRAQLHPTNPALDQVSQLFADFSFNTSGEALSGGNLAIDPVDRVIVSIALGASTFESFRFVDLKRAPALDWRRPTAPGGDSALKAQTKGEPGLVWDPVDGCYVGFVRGTIASPGASPGGMWRIFKPAPVGGVTPDTGWSISRRDAPGGSPVPSVEPLPGELYPAIGGRWRWAESLRVGLFATRYQVWAYIPAGWTDPRL